jgi:hypothetical protein
MGIPLDPDTLLYPDTLLDPDGLYVGPFSWTSGGDTPDELAEPLSFTTVLCKSTGEPVDFLTRLDGRQIIQQLNLPVSYSIIMRMEDPAYEFALLDQNPRLKVYRPSTAAELVAHPTVVSQLVFYGSLPALGVEEDSGTGMAKLTFQDPMWVLNQLYVQAAVTYTGVDQGSILWQLIALQNARTNGDTWIRQGVITTGILRTISYTPGKELAGLIQEMTATDQGCDVAFLPVDYYSIDGTRAMGTFNAYAQRGSLLPDQKFVYTAPLTVGEGGGLKSNVGSIKRTRAKTVTSATSVGATDTQTYQNTTSPFGLLEDYETFSDVTISQVLLDKAVGKVANGQNSPMILEVSNPTREAPQPLIDYNLGDTVYVTCRRGGMEFYDIPVRVQGIDITITKDGVLQTKPTLASLPSTIVSPTIPGGGGVSDGTGDAPGAERASPPAVGVNAAVTTPSHGTGGVTFLNDGVTDPDDAFNCTGGGGGWIYGTILGLVAFEHYILKVWVRGQATYDVPATKSFKLFVGGTASVPGEEQSADDSAHIWNATQATRETWTQLSLPFLSNATSMKFGIIMQPCSFFTQSVFAHHWTVEPA